MSDGEGGTVREASSRRPGHAGTPLVAMVVLAAVAVGVGNAVSYGFTAGYADAGGTLSPLGSIAVSLVALQGVGLLGAALGYLALTGRWDLLRVRRPTARTGVLVGAGVVAAFVLNLARTAVMVALDVSAGSPIVDAGAGADSVALVVLVMAVASFVYVAPIEELLFRGVIQGRLSETYGSTVAVVTASLLFALMHLPGLVGLLGGRLLTVVGLFAVSLVFGWLYERTGNLLVPWAVHALYNASLFAILYLVVASGVS